MRILITGVSGQLGKDLIQMLMTSHEVFGLDRQEMDVTDFSAVMNAVKAIHPEVIIHAAAYTKVDQAEHDIDSAYLVNAYGTRNIAIAAQRMKAKIVFISTDYVFDGCANKPYTEFDRPNPQSIYGKSKLAGEEMVKSFSDRHFIVRTSWLYGTHGNNFVKTMLRLADERDELFVVDDQIGSPTNSLDLALCIHHLIMTDKYGIYHATNTGSCSWYEFARAIFEEAGLLAKVNPISTKDFSQLAPRPAYSVLGHMALRLNGFSELKHWRESLRDFLSLFSETPPNNEEA